MYVQDIFASGSMERLTGMQHVTEETNVVGLVYVYYGTNMKGFSDLNQL